MPGEFISDGRAWKPAMIQRHQNGAIRVEDAQKKRIMQAVTKVMPDPDDPTKQVTMTKEQELGPILTMEDPAQPGRILPFVTPDSAALETIRGMLGEGHEEATEFPITAYPEAKTTTTVLNAEGSPAMAEQLKAQAAEIAQLKAMVESMVVKGNT